MARYDISYENGFSAIGLTRYFSLRRSCLEWIQTRRECRHFRRRTCRTNGSLLRSHQRRKQSVRSGSSKGKVGLCEEDRVRLIRQSGDTSKNPRFADETGFNFESDVLPKEFKGLLERERRVIDVEKPDVNLVKAVIESEAQKREANVSGRVGV